MTQPRPSRDGGFTLIELIVALGLSLLACGAAVSLLHDHTPLAQTQPRRADLQQRGRIAADVFVSELSTAGAWADAGGLGPGFAGHIPVLHPRRVGLRRADPAGTARPDVITLVRAAPASSPARLLLPVVSGLLSLDTGRGCAVALPLCGFREDDDVVVRDETGIHDFFRVGEGAGATARLILRQAEAPHAFPVGAVATRVETRTFYFDAAARQLRQYDGYQSDVPVIDDVEDVRFEYWGHRGVPRQGRPTGAGQSTCWFDSAGQPRFGRAIAAPGEPDVPLGLDEFRDGPWCGAGPNTFDADLLRIRRVRAVVRLRATSRAAHGPMANSANEAPALTPDLEVTCDVTPRMLTADY